MALILGEKWPPIMSRTPAAFERIENEIWQAFLDGYGDSYEYFHYNVKIGEDRISEEERKDSIKRMTEELALKRIDAVGKRGSTWDVIEIRRHAGPGTVGQILTYESLWVTYAPGLRPYTVAIVTDYMDIDTQLGARARGLSVFIV